MCDRWLKMSGILISYSTLSVQLLFVTLFCAIDFVRYYKINVCTYFIKNNVTYFEIKYSTEEFR